LFSAAEAALRCPVCRAAFVATAGGVRCASGHSFDRARQGYLNLAAGLGRPALGADDAAAVDARLQFLTAGHFAPLVGAVVETAAAVWPGGLVLDAGSGPGHYLAAVLDVLPDAEGLAMDSSAAALRRAARCHARARAVGWDLREPLPLTDHCAGVLRADGALLAVTPGPGHLADLVGPLGLLSVDADKPGRLAAALDPWFTPVSTRRVASSMCLSRAAAAAVVRMGPSAHHVRPGEVAARLAALPEPIECGLEVDVAVYRPRG
jgi:23S rRNA (guanine745-N1)-methyltransferase